MIDSIVKTSYILPDPLKEITGLSADSRKVKPGFLFAALPGIEHDGQNFIQEALNKGATAILAPLSLHDIAIPDHVAFIPTDAPRQKLAHFSAAFFQRQPDHVTAITGTNGKSSVAGFLHQIWKNLGYASASLGTVGLESDVRTMPVMKALTTPDPISLHYCLFMLEKAGISHLALEASSHGLDQYRLDGVMFEAAAFTNLSRDHLDYHESYEAYFNAKARLFDDLLPRGGLAVIHAIPPYDARLKEIALKRGLRVLSYSSQRKDVDFFCDITAIHKKGGADLTLFWKEQEYRTKTVLTGNFQIENLLCAASLAVGLGEDIKEICAIFPKITAVKGRLDQVDGHKRGARIFVDFAHTPEALQTVLKTLRFYCQGRLICLFGCGGDRDKGKRPEMGKIAMEYSDKVIVSDDNPRTEDPATIRRDILKACPSAVEIAGRKKAIYEAVALLKKEDILLVAGKGHENEQIIGDQVFPFDDKEIIKNALEGGQKEGGQKEGGQKEGGQKEGWQKEGGQKEGGQKEGGQKEGGQKEGGQKEGGQKEGWQKERWQKEG